MKIKLFLLFALFFFENVFGQEKNCFPDCNIEFEQIEALRIPTTDDIMQYAQDWIIVESVDFNKSPENIFTIGNNKCGDLVNQMLNNYLNEDNNNRNHLHDQACSYQMGYMEYNPETCEAGGPICCPAKPNHWYKVDENKALNYYKLLMKRKYDERLQAIGKTIAKCRTSIYKQKAAEEKQNENEIKNLVTSFNKEYSEKFDQLNDLSKTNPQEVQKLKDEINSYKNEFQAEADKGKNANHEKLQEIKTRMLKIDDGMRLIEQKSSDDKKTTGNTKSDKKEEKTNKNNNSDSTYVESDEARKLRERSDAQYKTNQAEDAATTAGLAGIATLGGLLAGSTNNDFDDEGYPFILRGILGANMQNIPVTDNYSGSGYVASSKSSNTLPICLSAGLEAKFLSNHRFGFSLNPFFNYGFLAFSSETGNYTNYGGNINLKYGKKLQILLKGSYEKRNGTKSYDAAEMGVDGLTTAEYDYSVLRYGLGLKYDFVEAAMFKENLSFLKNTDANIFSYELSMAYNIFEMAFKYAPNYPIAGIVKYPNQYEINKQSFFFIGMNFRFAITKSN